MGRTIDQRFPVAATVFLATTLAFVSHSKADFVGSLELLPPGCETAGNCRLGQDFGFVDASGLGWQASKGLLTDGASIPPWARPLVGAPFEAAFIKAAVIHDHYCDRHVRPWRQTHRVFYDALIASQVSKSKAGVMYFAVMIGGPKWARLIRGRPCPVGMSCINQVNVTNSVPGSAIALGEAGELYVSRPDEYGSARFVNTLSGHLPDLEKSGEGLTAEDVERLAGKAMADDFYYRNGDEVGSGVSVTLQTE
ncbi:DUF1353 domain-containing protein [Sinorhizobium sojae]|uniref:DUF1353 domain-containing protein n=1 Tax=Sinorhizobium sojae TaxID=716925 RepID=UPI000680A07C|nr:DUF1353 domain-containing protein [Sinorhizobium sojae]